MKENTNTRIYVTPLAGIQYAIAFDEESVDSYLEQMKIPRCVVDTTMSQLATTYSGIYNSVPYILVYAENVVNKEGVALSDILSALAHEAYHVTRYMTDFMGDHQPSEEFVAYSLQLICFDFFNEYFKLKEGKVG